MTQTRTHTPAYPAWGDERATIDTVMAWVQHRLKHGSDPMTTARPASALAAAIGQPITDAGIGADAAMRLFTEGILPATRAQDDPMNLAYIPSAPTKAALAFELATSASNIFAGVWESGAGAIFAENQALAFIASLIGWPDGAGGCFVAGGTMGNLSALVAARHTAETMREARGLPRRPEAGWAIACSADAHSSVASAARVMGVDIIAVPGDAMGRLTGAAVEAALADHAARLCAVVATAGTTNAGIVDDFAGVGAACRAHGVWLHVDGAYGGAALLAPSAAPRFAGIDQADSFIVDPHKWLFAPYDACALVYREPAHAIAAHQQRASYLDLIDREQWNPSDLAVHLSRRPRGLPLWFSLATHGVDRYRVAVERCLAIARQVAQEIRDRPYLRLLVPPELSVMIFDRPGWDEADYTRWSRERALAGEVLCVPTRWKGEPVLRMAFVNPDTEVDAVARVLDSLQ